jgi:RimJ/RimL family protein N-acetyltransferase
MNKTLWLKDVELNSDVVRLAPLRKEHRDALVNAAADGKLWTLWFTSVPSEESIDDYIETALQDKKAGRSLSFVVIEQATNKVIGSTRFCNADPINKRVEIGYTWYAKRYQRSAINSHCKRLLLQHAFETLNVIAVEFRTHWHNQKSRSAIARLGAKQDGVLRNHQKMSDGSYRDTVVFSIIDQEWPVVRKSLDHKLAEYL